MSRHFHIDICITKEQVDTVKRELEEYLDESKGFNIHVSTDSGVDPSPQLEAVLKDMFITMVMCAYHGTFTEVN